MRFSTTITFIFVITMNVAYATADGARMRGRMLAKPVDNGGGGNLPARVAAIQEQLDNHVANEFEPAESRLSAAEATLTNQGQAIVDVQAAVVQAEQDANAYTDAREAGITTAFQAAAAQAEQNANAYTDTNVAAVTTAYQAAADQAEGAANGYTDTKLAAALALLGQVVHGETTCQAPFTMQSGGVVRLHTSSQDEPCQHTVCADVGELQETTSYATAAGPGIFCDGPQVFQSYGPSSAQECFQAVVDDGRPMNHFVWDQTIGHCRGIDAGSCQDPSAWIDCNEPSLNCDDQQKAQQMYVISSGVDPEATCDHQYNMAPMVYAADESDSSIMNHVWALATEEADGTRGVFTPAGESRPYAGSGMTMSVYRAATGTGTFVGGTEVQLLELSYNGGSVSKYTACQQGSNPAPDRSGSHDLYFQLGNDMCRVHDALAA